MFIYKFRVFYDEVDGFIRDVEIKSTDSFESLHKILYSSIGLTTNELASFSICDSKWNKQNEITLIDMGDEKDSTVPEYDDEDNFTTKSDLPKFVMKDVILKDKISEPHQQVLYEYDFLNPHIFYLELIKISKAEEGVEYPRCTFKAKEIPKSSNNFPLPNPDDDFSEESIDDNDFEDGYNDEDRLDLDNFDDYKDF